MDNEYRVRDNRNILDFTDLTPEETKRLNDISGVLMKPYTEFVDEYSKRYEKNYLFWATPFASRNIYHDNTFFRLCRVELALQLAKEGAVKQIITETEEEYQTLKAELGETVDLTCKVRVSSIQRIKNKMNCMIDILRFCKDKIMYIMFLGNRRLQYPEHMAVVVNFAVSSYFEDHTYTDKYMPHIADYRQNVYFLPIIIYNSSVRNRELLRCIRECRSHKFIIGGGLLRIYDLSQIIKYLRFVRGMSRGDFFFRGLNVSQIVRKELVGGLDNRSTYDGLLIRKMIQRMRSRGISPDSFVLWYEGQPSDVIIASTVREEYPGVRTVGYEGFPPEENLMSLYVSEYQYRSGHSPEIMTAPGPIFKQMAHQFCDDVPVIYAPILRNEYKLDHNRKVFGGKRILLLLPIFQDVSREEILMLDRYVNNNGSYHVLIRNHPVNRDYSLKDYGIESVSFQYEFASGDLADNLKEADVVLASLTTSGMEILFAGVPLVILCPPGKLCFTALPLSLKDKLYHVAYDYGEMERALDLSLLNPVADNSVLENMLVPRTDETVGRIFNG